MTAEIERAVVNAERKTLAMEKLLAELVKMQESKVDSAPRVVANETLAEEPVNQFCGKDPVKQSLEEVLSSIASLSEFLKVYNYSNVTFSR